MQRESNGVLRLSLSWDSIRYMANAVALGQCNTQTFRSWEPAHNQVKNREKQRVDTIVD